MTALQTTDVTKRRFSSFTYPEAMQYVDIANFKRWRVEGEPIPLSDFLRQRLERLQRFDWTSSKDLLVDAICEEGLEYTSQLKIWKGAALEGEDVSGQVSYLVAPRKAYVESPIACIVGIKDDDFKQATAQCLVGMRTCQRTTALSHRLVDVYGAITNGEGWKFYRMEANGEVSESLLSGIEELPILLGRLQSFFALCERSLG
ncbi:MAG: hypothetical protein WA947_01010 [Phormidesmis sp.]